MSLSESKINTKRSAWKRYDKLNSGNTLATLEFFKSNPHYHRLSDFHKIFAEMFWTRRFCNHSAKELAEDLGLTKQNLSTGQKILETR